MNNQLSTPIDSGQLLQDNSQLKPYLDCKINFHPEQIIFSQDGKELGFQVNHHLHRRLEKLFLMMDGSNSMEQLQQIFFPHQPEIINSLVKNLSEQGFLDGVTQVKLDSGIDTLQELRELSQKLLEKNWLNNSLWRSLQSPLNNISLNILYGFAIEYYYFLDHKYTSETSLLNFQGSAKIRKLINQLYLQSSGQEKLLLEALESININQDMLINIMPLPETMGLCNSLAYWANFEPLFYFVTLDILSSQTWQIWESYRKTCNKIKLESDLIKPIANLVNNLFRVKQENITEQIFLEINHLDCVIRQRFHNQIYLFIEIYHNFHQAIWNHYYSSEILDRQVTTI